MSQPPANLPPPREATRKGLPALGPFFDRRAVRQVAARREGGLLASMRVRKKLLLLHTFFTIALGAVLLVTLRPAVNAVVREAEIEKSITLLDLARRTPTFLQTGDLPVELGSNASARTMLGTASELTLPGGDALNAINAAGMPVRMGESRIGPGAVMYVPARAGGADTFVALSAVVPQARTSATRLYILTFVALLTMYLLVAIAAEALVLPQSVYRPIRRMLEADDAVQQGRKEAELIPDAVIPGDELGEIMRSRNESVLKLRQQETALNDALTKLEDVANDLKTKNHLLETAQRNLADADRLASLGIMSAGIAHELNTPLAVIKGLTERMQQTPHGLSPADAALMLRVVGRLERLSESLLDYARVRPPRSTLTDLHQTVQESVLLVNLDRDARDVVIVSDIPEQTRIFCDGDRMVQVFVNLIRNAVDATRTLARDASQPRPTIRIACSQQRLQQRDWLVVRVTDEGPGIAPDVIPRLFEPFVSTRLDSKGTGLGLAVAEGIVREHGGLLRAGNRTDRRGAIFEVMLPLSQPTSSSAGNPPPLGTPANDGAAI
ncbi:MAG TPA: HAMP domain-containing sensor histidine kinase [Phycisphaerales bacterium]|nr:HAMP domain-containing sensor histidine kinase [Phycisphaerales bacterium]